MNEIPGKDTIQGLVGEPPICINLERKVVEAQQRLMKAWNSNYIAVIPYCFKCKVPLTWHEQPDKHGVMFHCPECMRLWTMKKEV